MFNLLRNGHTLLWRCHTIFHFYYKSMRDQLALCLCQHLTVNFIIFTFIVTVLFFFYVSHLNRQVYFIIMIFMCNSLMYTDVKQFSGAYMASTSSLWRSICSNLLPSCVLGCLFYYWDLRVLYVLFLNTCSLSNIWFQSIFSEYVFYSF